MEKKVNIRIALLIICGINSIFFYSCKKEPALLTDIDGNVYNSIEIGSQTWMLENLKTSRFNDGSAIPMIANFSDWMSLCTPGFCWNNFDMSSYKDSYGALYNFYVISTDKLCPRGWHVPTDPEWTLLVNYCGGELIAGGKLKEEGLSHWNSPNSSSTNESGFTALPGGCMPNYGFIQTPGTEGFFWSSTSFMTSEAWMYSLLYNSSMCHRQDYPRTGGFSVRCIKD
jgi:uncharacterized protein (TIGR02145 family)